MPATLLLVEARVSCDGAFWRIWMSVWVLVRSQIAHASVVMLVSCVPGAGASFFGSCGNHRGWSCPRRQGSRYSKARRKEIVMEYRQGEDG